jgi:uncharacterized repeat protein (TIGR02543 family)
MKKQNTLQTLGALTLSLVLAVFFATCDGGYQPNVTGISFSVKDYNDIENFIIRKGETITLYIECNKPKSVSDDKLTIEYSFDIKKLTESNPSFDSKDVDEEKTEYTGKGNEKTKTVLNGLRSFWIDLTPNDTIAATTKVQFNVTVEPGHVEKTCEITVAESTDLIVTFDKNGGDTNANPLQMAVISPKTTTEKLPTEPTRAGFTFNGWNEKADGSGTAFNKDTTVSADTIVYAQWKTQ